MDIVEGRTPNISLPFKELQEILFPVNVQGDHWVFGNVKISKGMIKVFDLEEQPTTIDKLKEARFGALCKFLRLLLSLGGFFSQNQIWRRPTKTKQRFLPICRSSKGVSSGFAKCESGIYAMKCIEEAWKGELKPFDF